MISAIAIIGKNLELGCQNKLLWDIPEDMAHFRRATKGKTVIMGRKTLESIGGVLPGRKNIIITRDKNFSSPNCKIYYNLEEALKKENSPEKEIFIIGGAQIYEQALPFCDKLYLTIVDDSPKADAFFPDFSQFKIISEQKSNHKNLKIKFLELKK